MKNGAIRTGLDCRGGIYYGARVDHSTGRPEIKTLVRSDKASLGQQPLLLHHLRTATSSRLPSPK
jgi:hypothetical protein